MGDTSGWMKIGDVAEILGTTTRTLRFYDQQELIAPRRSGRGTRLYSQEDVERFRAILLLGRLGVSLQEIRKLAVARRESATGNDSSHKVASILDDLKRQAREQLELLTTLLADIEGADRLVRQCFGCRKRPHRKSCDPCPVGARLPESVLLKLVWEPVARAGGG